MDQIIAFIAGSLITGGAIWLVSTMARLRARVAELERLQKDGPDWAANLKLDHRAQLASIATLSELALSDLLDATIRLSPEAARRAIEKHAPHLFFTADEISKRSQK